ncbi:MAG: multidrug efflux pump subunit AcrB [Verrucomicrobiales bacterium]|jgi:multidrug efflux pump subunit AcrB
MFEIFFQKTTLARLLILSCLIGGFVAYQGMIKETDPDLEIGAGVIITPWLGVDAPTIEQELTTKLESELKQAKGLKELSSGSFSGYSVVVAEFHPNVPKKDALDRIRTGVNQAEGHLSKDARAPQIYEVSVNDTPILSIILSGDGELKDLSALAKKLKKDLERVPGVNKVDTGGGREEIVMVSLIGARMAALGISPSEVRDVISAANLDMPWGEFEGEELGSSFRLFGRFRDVEALQSLPIRRASTGRVIYLDEVAKVERTLAKEESRNFFSSEGKPFQRSLSIAITKQSGSDTIKVVEQVRKRLKNASADWPPRVRYDVVYDSSIDIWANLKSVFTNGWQAMLAVFVILLISLTWREALIAGLAIPLAFGAALIIVAALGYSLNQIVIVGMVLALGLLVDDFILVMEGMHENIYVRGRGFKEAAADTVKTYALPSLSGSLTTILAMAPLLGIAGVTGKYIRPMPVTTIACLIASYLISLVILIPMSRYLFRRKKGGEIRKTWMDKLTDKGSRRLRVLLKKAFTRNRKTALGWVGGALVVFVGSILLFSTVPTELMGKSDGRSLGILVEMEPNTSLDNSQHCADRLGEVLRALPYFESITKHVGEKSPFSIVSPSDELSLSEAPYFIGFTAVFTPRTERDKLAYEYMPELREELESVMQHCPGGKLLLNPSTGDSSAGDPIGIDIVGDDTTTLREIGNEVVALFESVPGATDMRHNLSVAKIDMKAIPDLEAMEFYGLSPSDVAEQMRIMLSADEIGKFPVGGTEDDLEIRLGYAWPSREGEIGSPTSLEEWYFMNVTTPEGQSVPLLSVVDIEMAESPISIIHKDGERTVSVMGKNNDRTVQEILAEAIPKLEEASKAWPPGYRFRIAGEAVESEEVFGSSRVMMILALLLVFGLLTLQFDHFVQPLIIMSAIPLALTGTFLGLFVLQMPFSFMGMVGLIALVGIVVNDTIIMVQVMNNHRAAGLPVKEAAARGASDRLRPIVTTSITTIAGMVPLALSQKMWLPLGVTVVSGLIFATFLALLIVPCLYVLLTRDSPQASHDTASKA